MRRTPRRAAALLVGLLLGCTLGACTVPGGGPSRPAVDLTRFTPSAQDPDPSHLIDGVQVSDYKGAQHVRANQQVAYRHSPPMGGNHDQAWAACNGVVYPRPVRSENLVHSMEHGAVWIAYDPERISGAALDALAARVENQPYLVMSPYPGLDQPISVQSWNHQLKLADATDQRIDEFVVALRQNANTYPEPGASCAEVGPPYFDRTDPPAYAPAPSPSGVDGTRVLADQS